MAYIGRNPAIGTQKVLDSLESQFNGTLTTFDLRYNSNTIYPPIASALIVSLGGVLQEPGVAYTVASDTITFASAPPIGTDCWILLYTEFGAAGGGSANFTVSNNLTIGNELHGPANFVIDPAAIGDNTGTVEIKGNLTVQGTQTTVNSTTVDLDHLSLGDNEVANFGDDNDLQIYHDGNNSYVEDTGVGALIMKGSTVRIRSITNENMLSASQNGAISLYYDSDVKLETTSTGATITGTVVADGLSLGTGETANFGNSNNLQISHNVNGLIANSAGNLILASNGLKLKNGNSSKSYYEHSSNGEVKLFYDNDLKLETTNTGLTVTGTVVASGFSGSGASLTAVDADTLDGLQASSFLRSDANDIVTATTTWNTAGTNAIVFNKTATTNYSGITWQEVGDPRFLMYVSNTADGSFNLQARKNGTNIKQVFAVTQSTGIINFNQTGATIANNTIWHAGNDGSGSGLDADTLDGQQGSYYTNAANLTGTLPAIDGSNLTGIAPANASTLDNLDSTQFLRSDAADTFSGDLTSSGTARILLKKTDNDVSDHLQFYNGTTRVGEIGCQDTTWLRINQVTSKNIYTPRYIRADGGFFVDGTAKGINGSGNFIGGTISGASDVTSSSTASTVVQRNSSSDILCRLVRPSYQNQSTISGAMAYRVNNGSDNYIRFCSDKGAIRSFLGVSATGGDANYMNVAGDTATGTMTFNGVVNIRNALDFADGDVLRMGSSDDWTVSFNGSNNWTYINQKGNGIIFQDNGTNIMVLEDSGIFRPNSDSQCAIGTTTRRWNIAYLLNVRSQSQGSPGHNNSTTGYGLSSNGSGYFSRSGGEALYCNRNQNGGIVRFGRAGAEKGQIVMNTNSVAYQTTSDYRLKENVVALENGIERVKQLKPYRFNFIDDPDETLDGFLAHEAQEVVHECASGTKDEMEDIGTLTEWDGTVVSTDVPEPPTDELSWEDVVTDEEGNETTQTRTRTWTQTGTQPVHQGIDQAKLVPLLTAALQEAITKIEQLEARITQLEST